MRRMSTIFASLLTGMFCWDHPSNKEALMPHPVYGPPVHQLESIRITINLPSPENGHMTSLRVLGETSTQRSSLWSESASWTADEVTHGLQPSDWLSHVVLVALQDRPKDQEALDLGLTGQGWEDVALPF